MDCELAGVGTYNEILVSPLTAIQIIALEIFLNNNVIWSICIMFGRFFSVLCVPCMPLRTGAAHHLSIISILQMWKTKVQRADTTCLHSEEVLGQN